MSSWNQIVSKFDKNVVIIRAYPVIDWSTQPEWSEKANRWAYSIDSKYSTGPSEGGYTSYVGAIKAGERFLKKINPKLEPKKTIMYYDKPYIEFKEYGSKKRKRNKTKATKPKPKLKSQLNVEYTQGPVDPI